MITWFARENCRFVSILPLCNKISLTVTKHNQFTTHGTNLPAAVFVMIAADEHTAAPASSGAPIVFLIAKANT